MQEDKSFLGLTLSILVHITVVLLVMYMPSLNLNPPHEAPTEITIVDPNDNHHDAVSQLQVPKKLLIDDLKEKTKLVSQLTQRVKKQMLAKRIGHPHNSPDDTPAMQEQQPHGRQQTQANHGRAGGMSGTSHPEIQSSMKGLQPKPKDPNVIGPPGTEGGGLGKNLMMGPSSIDQVIPGVANGAMSFLNTDQFTYYTFFKRLSEQFTPRWSNMLHNYAGGLNNDQLARLGSQDRITQGEVVLDQEGNYLKSFIHHSSGDQGADMAAIDAFQAASPIPNPPKGLIEEDGFIHIHFRVTVVFQPRAGFGPN